MKTLKIKDCRSVCPVANALDFLGDRWSLLVIRDLLFLNKHEFGEFMGGPERIATNILADRLKTLQECGVIASRPHPSHKNKKLYYLTRMGKGLLPVLVELILWGAAYLQVPDMPRAKFEKVRKNPKKFMRATLDELTAWEEKNLP